MGLLEELGYENVRHYVGGIADWKESGRPLEAQKAGKAEAATAGKPIASLPPQRFLIAGRDEWLQRALDAVANSSFSALLGIWLWMVIGFGVAYWVGGIWLASGLTEGGTAVASGWRGLFTALYFSFVTATSLGFGDVLPVGSLRILAIAEAAAGLLLFGCIISKLVSRRQEQLIEEIHRIAFEDRLGRVRTNLHLVLSELQSISSGCAEGSLPPDRILPRAESAAMVFIGELHAVHDLLYRPQQVPEEAVFEAILAALAAGLREFSDLMGRLPEARSHSTLSGSARSISSLAGEICGNCVPRDYAPELKLWMDRIQELARDLSKAEALPS